MLKTATLRACFGIGALCVVGACSSPEPASNDSADTAATTDDTTSAGSIDAGPCPRNGDPCDDGQPCTVGDKCEGGSCKSGANWCGCTKTADCPSDDKCNPMLCDKAKLPWTCRINPAKAVKCSTSADGPCEASSCDAKTGSCVKKPRPDNTPCDDGLPCSIYDQCKDGKCAGKEPPGLCDCQTSADCKDDGNPCNGVLFCDKTGGVHKCRVNPASIVKCADSADTTCAKNVCQPKTGKCAPTPIENLVCTSDPACDCTNNPSHCSPHPIASTNIFACDDGDKCTPDERCANRKCVAETNTCVCESDKDCAAKDDGDQCNGTMYCNKVTKKCTHNPASVVVCPTVNDGACLKNVCLPSKGVCQFKPLEAVLQTCKVAKDGKKTCAWNLAPPGKSNTSLDCEDGDKCTKGDVCNGGKCLKGKDTCGCTSDKDCAGQEDGDACNGKLFCNAATKKCQLNPATIVVCKSGGDTPCAKNACVRKTGACDVTATDAVDKVCDVPASGQTKGCRWVQKPAGAPLDKNVACDDGDKCTVSDVCAGKTCTPGTFACACGNDADCVKQDDGNLCNGTLYCDKSVAKKPVCKPKPSSAKICSTANDTGCFVNACLPGNGACQMTIAERARKLCEDAKGKWQPVGPDGKGVSSTCRREKLAPTAPDTHTTCDDNNPCTVNDFCLKGKCFAGPKGQGCECFVDKDCDHKVANPCTERFYCDKSTKKWTCKKSSITTFCTKKTGTICRVPACHPATGECYEKPVKEGATCDDDSACTSDDACKKGQCAGKDLSCDDKSLCTKDYCDPKKGCVFKAKKSCDDANDCTVDSCDAKTGKCVNDDVKGAGKQCNADNLHCTPVDRCASGVCKAGNPVVCDNKVGQCQRAVCLEQKDTFKCVVEALKNGDPCADSATCTVGATCHKGTCLPGSINRYFETTHAPLTAEGQAQRSGRFAAVLALKSGLLLAGKSWSGSNGSGSKGSPSSSAWWLAQTGPGGKVAWHKQLDDAKASAETGATAVAKSSKGAWVVAGTTNTANAGLNAKVVLVQPASDPAKHKLVTPGSFGKTDSDELVYAVATNDSGSIAMAGERRKSGKSGMWLLLLNSAGEYHADYDVSLGTQSKGTARAVKYLSTGNVLVAGWSDNKGRLLEVQANGKVKWQQAYGQPTKLVGGATDPRIHALTKIAGGWLLVGEMAKGTTTYPMLLATGPLGAEKWRSTRSIQGGYRAVATIAGSDKRVVLSGVSRSGGSLTYPWLAMAALDGNVQWQRELQVPGGGEAAALAVTADGTLAAAGLQATKDGDRGFVLRSNAWGRTTCDTTDPCLGRKLTDCDDGKACTADSCDKDTKGGCFFTNTDAFTCRPNDGCSLSGACKSGQCIADSNGKYFRKTLPDEALQIGALEKLPSANGEDWDYAVGAWQTKVTLQPGSTFRTVWRAYVRRHGRDGSLKWKLPIHTQTILDKYGTAPAARVGAIKRLPDGSMLVGVNFMRAYGSNYWRPDGERAWTRWSATLARVSAVGKVLWNNYVGTPTKKCCSLYYTDNGAVFAIRAYSDGKLAVVGEVNSGGGSSRYGMIRRYNVDGAVEWTAKTNAITASVADAHVDKFGVVTGVGTHVPTVLLWQPRKPRNGLLLRANKNGKVLEEQYVDRGGDEFFRAVTKLRDATLLAGGVHIKDNKRAMWLLALDSALKTKWERKTAKDSAPIVTALMMRTDGLFASGPMVDGIGESMWLARLDLQGAPIWSRTYPGTVTSREHSRPMVSLDDGGFALGDSTGKLLRTDVWGHADCVSSGKCSKLKPTSCDDKNPCTTDFCDGAKGCQHTQAVCTDGNTCTDDTCKVVNGKTVCSFKQKSCDDGIGCTVDTCKPSTGCKSELKPCTKGPCLVADCTATKACQYKNCDDNDACTIDSCDNKTGTCINKKPTCGNASHCIVGTPVCGAKPHCDDGFEFGGSCYTFFPGRKITWSAAAQLCWESGRHLVAINSKAENDFVQGQMLKNGHKYAFLGLYYGHSNQFLLSDGSKAQYTNWYATVPKYWHYGGQMLSNGGWRLYNALTVSGSDPRFIVCEGYSGLCTYKAKLKGASCYSPGKRTCLSGGVCK